jgi:hypothetical protein
MATESWNTSLERPFEVTRRDLVKDKALKHGAWLTPLLLSGIPAGIFLIVGLFSLTPTTVAFFFSLGFISLIVGFIFGLIISGILLFYRQKWLAQVREKIAIDGIKTEEVEWFKHELTSAERKALGEIESQNRLLGDAYRETLASRLTASRITKSTKKELLLVQKRQNKLKYLKSEATAELQEVLKNDHEKLSEINSEAKQMRIEAETRLQMIEAASRRGTNLAETELALKKLSSRAAELPLALEALKMEDEIRKELEAESDAEPKSLPQ